MGSAGDTFRCNCGDVFQGLMHHHLVYQQTVHDYMVYRHSFGSGKMGQRNHGVRGGNNIGVFRGAQQD